MFTITKTNFGQISFKATIVDVKSLCLGHGKYALNYSIMERKDENLQKMI